MAKIGGVIVSSQGQILSGAIVTLRNPDGAEVVHDTTDQAGEWYIDNDATEGSGFWLDIQYPGYGQAVYPSNAAPTIINLDKLEATPVPKWVWAVAAVLVIGGTLILLRTTFKNK